jgi:hypothetical protein
MPPSRRGQRAACQLAGPLENGNRGVVVVPDNLAEAADPEQRLGLTAYVAEGLIELRRPLEQGQLARIPGWLPRVLVSLRKESPVNDPAAARARSASTASSSRSASASALASPAKTNRSYSSLARSIRSSALIVTTACPDLPDVAR